MGGHASDPAVTSAALTFLFTDIEGSTRMWERHPQAMNDALRRHDEILADAVERCGGTVVKTTGDGIMAAFDAAPEAVRACLAGQLGLGEESWGEPGPLEVRMGLHAGAAHAGDGDYHGPVVNRTARIMSVAHGGQIVLSEAVTRLLDGAPPEGASLRDLGEHRLKDLERAERLYQLVHPELDADFPPLRSLNLRRHNLPTQASAFIGREEELRRIADLLAGPVRLLTLTGPGGTGKTRLALQAAADQIDRYDDGVFLVDLAPTRDVEQVLAAIIRTVGLEEAEGHPRIEDIARQLTGDSLLLVLDNFEQVMEAALAVVELLAACPALEVMVTSREPLRVRGEQVFAVPTLGVAGATGSTSAAEALHSSEAVQLFVERARAADPSFELTDDDVDAVVDICRRLDGLPLAIELAAARLRLFSPQALRERLGGGTGVLGGGARDLPERQRTLRDTIAWSYGLLDPAEQLLFRLLSVFSGIGFEAAEATVAGTGHSDVAEIDVIEGLASLVDKSLLKREEDVAGSPRLGMLRTIREFAAARLTEDPGLEATTRRAHATHFASSAREQWLSLRDRKRADVLADLIAELDNLRVAWRYWIDAGDLDRLNDLVDALWLLFDTRGWHQAMVELTTDLLAVLEAAPATAENTSQQITLSTALGRVQLATKGYTDEVEAAYQRALDFAEREGEMPEVFSVLRDLAGFHNARDDFARGVEVAERLLHVAERQGDPGMLLEAHLVLGYTKAFYDDVDGGIAHIDRAVELASPELGMSRRFRSGPHPAVISFTTSGFMLWMKGFPDRVEERADRALALAAEFDHALTTAYAHYHVGFLRLWTEQPELAAHHAALVRDVAEEYDLALWRALGDCLQGATRMWLEGTDDGLGQLDHGLEIYRTFTALPNFWPQLLYLKAQALGKTGRAADGSVLLDAAIARENDSEGGAAFMPDFAILKADLLLADSDAVQAEVAGYLEAALGVAAEVGLRMPRLRAATRLYRLHRGGDDEAAARATLEAAYDAFTEGWSAVPLVAARDLLETGGADSP
jgi:predicted ATPase/class 3 adenylate cyclase